MSDDPENILLGVEHALAGRWDDAHAIAQTNEGGEFAD